MPSNKIGRVELNLNIDLIRDALDDELDQALYEGAQPILEAAKGMAPVETGELRDSGYVATSKRSSYQGSKKRRKELKVEKGTAVIAFAAFYAGMIEVGTGPHKIGKPGQVLRLANGSIVRGPIMHPGKPAQPFLRPAFDTERENATNIIAGKLRAALEART